MRFLRLALGGCAAAAVAALAAADRVAPPSAELAAAFQLSTNYTKCVTVEGLPLVGSAKVSDYALLEAAYLVRKQVGERRPEILRAMAQNRVRLAVMAATEMTTDVPEHSDLKPKEYWNRRARGLGATVVRPAVSCAEENLLGLAGDPYWQECILIHEFAHALHERGLCVTDPTFDERLKAAYVRAREGGLWAGTYAMQNHKEYWAEGTQSWFDSNRANDSEHGPVDTRDKLKAYDPGLAALLAEIYGDTPWRYQRPAQRPESERAHLAGFDAQAFPAFRWPASAPTLDRVGTALAWLAPGQAPAASPRGRTPATSILFLNRRADTVSIDWVDFDGRRRHMAEVRPKLQYILDTYATHVFCVTGGGREIGAVVATEEDGRVEIR